jgi:hypothetical protein
MATLCLVVVAAAAILSFCDVTAFQMVDFAPKNSSVTVKKGQVKSEPLYFLTKLNHRMHLSTPPPKKRKKSSDASQKCLSLSPYVCVAFHL